MKLIDYLRAKNLTDDAFAALVGRSKWAVRKWMYSQRTPRPAEMLAISQATRGAVTADDFMPQPAPSSEPVEKVA
jgi:DNA-binding transcriptional regulator YdaS (Cro superfamily)